MPSPPMIRAVTRNDVAVLARLSSSTFFDAFAHMNKVSDVQDYIDKTYTEDNLSAELNCKNSKFYFAEINNIPVGYLKINFKEAQSEFQEAHGMEIARVYVDKQFQGAKTGTRLLEFAIEQAKAQTCSYVWLGVWEHNTNAIRFYQRMGFAVFSRHNFLLGTDMQTDLLMKKEL